MFFRAVASLTVPGWQLVPLSSFFLKFRSISCIFPQTSLIFFLILALRVGDSPTRKGPGYDTDVFAYAKVYTAHKTYSFAYAKYIVLQMYMVLHAAAVIALESVSRNQEVSASCFCQEDCLECPTFFIYVHGVQFQKKCVF